MYTNLHTFLGTCSMFLLVFHKNYNRYELRMPNFKDTGIIKTSYGKTYPCNSFQVSLALPEYQ